MNATSSRAHTVVTIQFEQICKNDMGQETKKTSIINLVDLAGTYFKYQLLRFKQWSNLEISIKLNLCWKAVLRKKVRNKPLVFRTMEANRFLHFHLEAIVICFDKIFFSIHVI